MSDIYLLDENSISIPYLGSDGPTVLDIPMGVSGQLTHLFIIFGMFGTFWWVEDINQSPEEKKEVAT